MVINKQIQSAIQTIVNRAIEIAPFNKTRTGTILAVNNNGTYKVLIDGVEYPNVPIRKNHIAEVGDVVKVVYPMNNASRMYIDDGYVNKTKTLTVDNLNVLGTLGGDVSIGGRLSLGGHGYIGVQYWNSKTITVTAQQTSWATAFTLNLGSGVWIVRASCINPSYTGITNRGCGILISGGGQPTDTYNYIPAAVQREITSSITAIIPDGTKAVQIKWDEIVSGTVASHTVTVRYHAIRIA